MPHGMWDLPGPGIEPMSPALEGGFFTTEPPGKSLDSEFRKFLFLEKGKATYSLRTTALLLLLSHFSRVRLCDPMDGSPPGPPSLGFSRQEYWSGVPFPSPMHESEK